MSKHASNCVPHEWEISGLGMPPDSVSRMVDQNVKFVLLHIVFEGEAIV
jgi:hypothetical protein